MRRATRLESSSGAGAGWRRAYGPGWKPLQARAGQAQPPSILMMAGNSERMETQGQSTVVTDSTLKAWIKKDPSPRPGQARKNPSLEVDISEWQDPLLYPEDTEFSEAGNPLGATSGSSDGKNTNPSKWNGKMMRDSRSSSPRTSFSVVGQGQNDLSQELGISEGTLETGNSQQSSSKWNAKREAMKRDVRTTSPSATTPKAGQGQMDSSQQVDNIESTDHTDAPNAGKSTQSPSKWNRKSMRRDHAIPPHPTPTPKADEGNADDVQAVDANTLDAKVLDSKSVDEAVGAQAEGVQAVDAKALDAMAVEAEAADANADDVKSVDDKAVDSRAGDAKAEVPEEEDTKAVGVQAADNTAVDAKANDNKAADADAADASADDVEAVEARAGEAMAVDSISVHGKTADARAVDAEAEDTKTEDAKSVDAKVVDAEAVGIKALDAEAMDVKAEDAKAIEAKSVDASPNPKPVKHEWSVTRLNGTQPEREEIKALLEDSNLTNIGRAAVECSHHWGVYADEPKRLVGVVGLNFLDPEETQDEVIAKFEDFFCGEEHQEKRMLPWIEGYQLAIAALKNVVGLYQRGLPQEQEHQFEVFEQVGEGGFGVVYKGAWQGMTVAVKQNTFRMEGVGEIAIEKAAFALNEASVHAVLNHPNVVATYAYGMKPLEPGVNGEPLPRGHMDWQLYIIQELCDAGNLEHALDDHRFFDKEQGIPKLDHVLAIARDMALGMEYIHSRNIIHGDIKPENIFLKSKQALLASSSSMSSAAPPPLDVVAKIGDFGLSIKMETKQSHVSDFQQGTPLYISPEVLETETCSKASDVFAFGVILWELYFCTKSWDHHVENGGVEHEGNGEFYPHYFSFDDCPIPAYAALGRACISPNPADRPSFATIAQVLAGIQSSSHTGLGASRKAARFDSISSSSSSSDDDDAMMSSPPKANSTEAPSLQAKYDREVLYRILSQEEAGILLGQLSYVELSCICVDPKFRGQGMGRELLYEAMRFSQLLGCRRMALVPAGNDDEDSKFWEALGFSSIQRDLWDTDRVKLLRERYQKSMEKELKQYGEKSSQEKVDEILMSRWVHMHKSSSQKLHAYMFDTEDDPKGGPSKLGDMAEDMIIKRMADTMLFSPKLKRLDKRRGSPIKGSA